MKAKSILIFAVVLFLFLFLFSGCQQKIVCNKPYVLIGNSCCLDKNDDAICDQDQQEEFLNNEAETTALKFAREWEAKEWSSMYDLFSDDIKKLKSKERFVKTATKLSSREKPYVIRLDELKQDNEATAYAYYTKSYTENAAIRKQPAIKVIKDKDAWKLEAFKNYFNACDELSVGCCGNKLCENAESAHKSTDYLRCSSDCFELNRYLDRDKKETDFSFLGKTYHFQILNFIESTESSSTLTLGYNNKEFTLSESSYSSYPTDHKVDDNVYVKFRYLNNVITITLFNKNGD